MNSLEDELRAARADVRAAVEHTPIPTPQRTLSGRRPMTLAVAASLLLLAGIGALWLSQRNSEAPELQVTVQPAEPSPVPTVLSTPTSASASDSSAEPSVPPRGVSTPTEVSDGDSSERSPLPDPEQAPQFGRLTDAAAGEFIVPLPGVQAWSADESMLLLYRTGSANSGHIVVSAATGQLITEVDLAPPDIEQVYWDPIEPARLVAFEGNAIVGFDVATGTRSVVGVVDGCDRLDAGYPSPPSTTGEVAVMCWSNGGGSEPSLVVFDLGSGSERRAQLPADVESVRISPGGEFIVASRADGTVRTFDAELAPLADLALDSAFAFVNGLEGDRLVAAVYSGDAIGTLVVVDPTQSTGPNVVIGPDRGDEYPPSGSLLSAVGQRVVISVRGPASGSLAGRLITVDLEAAADPVRATFEHASAGAHGYWSEVFVSLSPSGTRVAYSTDGGSDRVDTYIAEFPP